MQVYDEFENEVSFNKKQLITLFYNAKQYHLGG